MKKLIALAMILALVLVGCTSAPKIQSGDFNTVYSGELETLNYLVSGTQTVHAAAANTVDGLVEYNNLGILQPSLAKSWKASADGLVYTFTLREGVKWMTWEDKEYAEVTAQDFVDSLKYVLTSENASKTANIVYSVVKGAKAFYDGETTDFSTVGVKATAKHTLEFTLNEPIPYFLTMLTYVSFLPANGKFLAEVGDRFGTDHKTMLYNGAYILKNFEPQNVREYIKNEKYWDKSNVHIAKLTYRYNKEAGALAPALFLRGEITSAAIPTAVLDGWMNDPAQKEMVRPGSTSFYTFWNAFNFDPKFEAQYEPENWRVAVHNLSFRKAIFHGLDRVAAMMTAEPYEPSRRLHNTITPKNFVSVAGLDYTQLAPLAEITATDSFNADKAVAFKTAAMGELDGYATFPVKVMLPYNTGSSDWTNRVQVVEQQLETLLGKDFIDVVPVGFPPTGFLNAVRRAGNYALLEVNWGPDYADPETYTDMFVPGNSYSPIVTATGYDGVYEGLIDAAKAELTDLATRYELFAKAEAHLINEALVIPYAMGGGGFIASKLDPFTAPYAPFGISELKFKGQVIMEKAMSTEQYKAGYTQWVKDRADALKESGQ